MKCPKCDGELTVARTDIDHRDHIEVQLVCQENPEHKFETFIDADDIVPSDI